VATVGRCGGAVVVVGLLFRVRWGAEWWIARVSCVEGGRRRDSANRVKNCGGLQPVRDYARSPNSVRGRCGEACGQFWFIAARGVELYFKMNWCV
jgi:hypothetical protein